MKDNIYKLKEASRKYRLNNQFTWAYIGDEVYELFIRNKLINDMYATAFEALIGYLYLTKQNVRLREILANI